MKETKTKEQQAQEYAEDMCPTSDYCGGIYDEQRNSDLPIYIDDAKSVLTWLFDKPLRDRLTAEEKERVRKEYSNTYPLDPDCGVANILIQGVLERIFGKEFFKEDKE